MKNYIEQCKKIHSNKYDYSLSIYNKVLDKIKIICPEHGVFEQRLDHHKRGSKCPKCVNDNKRLLVKSFINKSNKIHNNKYDYSLIEYKNHMNNINIICPKHGSFYQTPNNHLNGKGCPKCKKNFKLTYDEFIKKANKKHNNKYDYFLVSFNNVKDKIQIICPIHGIFKQNVYTHINSNGCKKCNSQILNTEHFIELSKKIHNNKYIYNKSIFVKTSRKIKIICEKHGLFYQYPLHHINGNGCPKCKRSKGEEIIEKYLIQKNVRFEIQKSFSDCRFKNRLRFDFYLNDYNYCIEFDGEIHYKSIKYFGGDENLEYIITKDKIKNKYCEDNNIKLLRIKYDDNIIEKLKTII